MCYMGKGGGSGLSPDPRFHTTYMTGVPTIGANAHIYIYVTKFVLTYGVYVCTNPRGIQNITYVML
jgi:hypothetical protein